MSNTVYQYQVYCTTESVWVPTWAKETPTVCPNNNAHTIDSGSIYISNKVTSDEISIKEESVPTGGRYMLGCIAFTALANQITEEATSFDLPINIIDAKFQIGLENVADTMEWVVAPDTVVGAITSDVAIGDTVLNVSSTVIAYFKAGFYLSLWDGTNTNECGIVLSIDTINSQVTVKTATTNTFAAATPTYVRMTVMYVKNFEFGHPGALSIAEAKIGSSYLPAGTSIVCKYNNKSLVSDKRIVFYIEYLE